MLGVLFTWMVGGSGRRMVELGVETSFESAREGMLFLSSRLSKGDLLRTSGFTSASFGFQSELKLTIGRPGLSLTTVGVGNFGLRSLRSILVAFRISSLLISSPSLVGDGVVSIVGVTSRVFGRGKGEFAV